MPAFKRILISGLISSLALGSSSRAQSGPTLEVWYHQYGEAGTLEAVKRYAEEYTKATGVKVNVSWIPGDYQSKLNAALLSGQGPDVFEDNYGPREFAKAGRIVPLDDLFTPETRKDMDPAALAAFTVDGKLYAIKMVTDTQFLYYRKSLLAKAGLQPPRTFDQLLAAVKKLNTGGVKGLFIGNDAGVSVLASILPRSAGRELYAGDKAMLNTPRVVQAFEALRALNKSGGLLIGAPTDWWDPSAFNQGLAAMQWSGLWAMPAIQQAVGNDFGVMPWPKLDAKGKDLSVIGGWGAMINAKSKNIDAAKAYVKSLWITNITVQSDFNTSYGFHIPSRKTAIAAATKLKTGPARDAVLMAQRTANQSYGLWNGSMDTVLFDAAAAVIRSDRPVSEIVKEADQKLQAELTRASR